MKDLTCHNQRRLKSSAAFGLALFAGVLIFTGCDKAKITAPAPESLNQAGTDNPSAAAATNGQPDIPALNRLLVGWIVGHQRPPANFEEFAATAGVALPPPPPGKKYIITKKMHIQLVDK